MVRLRCQRCGHRWDYGGSAERYCTCPNCKTSVKMEDQREKDIEPVDGDVIVTLGEGQAQREIPMKKAVRELDGRLRDLGEAVESLRGEVREWGGGDDLDADQLAQREQVEEIGAVLKELVEGMGGSVEYETVAVEESDESGASAVAEAAAEVDLPE